ncbi:uncharacterized protein LOC132555916 [Ylistrum balloti]|uniref:uncharacterized protein LOC132555916 n=1 Tax=Ylistrum balloti TaxID=509963 RepID=UPI00290595A0|nr:uncharacterized protein LOC132555916 [Ylistrum balloti]
MASTRVLWRAQEPVIYTCSVCDSEDNVNWFCNDCQEALCDQCKEYHTWWKKSKHDDVVSIGKVNRQIDKPVSEVCKLHPGKLCDGYCCDCDMLVCSICLSQTHKHQDWKHLEDEFTLKKQHMKEHMTTISAKITHFKNDTLMLHRAKKEIVDNIDGMRKEVNSQRTKLKAEVDDIADTVLTELSALEKEGLGQSDEVRQQFEKNVSELTRLLVKAELKNSSNVSIFETERSLRSTLPLYDVNVGNSSQKIPSFVTGSINRSLLTEMFGVLIRSKQYAKVDINSNHVKQLSKFTVGQNILNICAIDDRHAWLSIYNHKGLVLVNREGVVTEEMKLDFCPYRIAMIGATDVLMSSDPSSTSVYKLSLHNKQVTTFADISPHQASDISINKTGDVFVTTETPDIVVLNQSGTIVRKFSCGKDISLYITSLSSGRLGVVVGDWGKMKIVMTDESGTVKNRWTGELDNGRSARDIFLCKMSCDEYDRLFIPDYSNNQIYVLPSDEKQAKCLLDQKHGVVLPTVVSVDKFGNVWIGCLDGTVHIIRL